jgi:hypothetical protein
MPENWNLSVMVDDLMDLEVTRSQQVIALSVMMMAATEGVPLPDDIFADQENGDLSLMWLAPGVQLGVDIGANDDIEFWHVYDSEEGEAVIWENQHDCNPTRRHFFGRIMEALSVA